VTKDNRLVAYIQSVDGDPFIDIVEVSKKGTSYYYDGVWWMREPVFRSGYCTNANGQKLKINPLSRSYDLYENHNGNIEVKESARERYEQWVNGELKP